MVERRLIKPEVRVAILRISKVKEIEYLINFLQKTTEYLNIVQGIPSQKIITSCLPTETKASLTVLNYGDVAQMVERSLCMREVPGLMPRISKTRATHQMVITISR